MVQPVGAISLSECDPWLQENRTLQQGRLRSLSHPPRSMPRSRSLVYRWCIAALIVRCCEPHYLQPREFRALLDGAGQHANAFLAQRDTALLATFLGTGARVSELIRLDLKHLDVKSKRVRLHRKGGDVQTLPLSAELVELLRTYLKDCFIS